MVKEELEKYGHYTNWGWRFYKIDTENLDNSKLIIMIMTDDNGIFERKFIPFGKDAFEKYTKLIS